MKYDEILCENKWFNKSEDWRLLTDIFLTTSFGIILRTTTVCEHYITFYIYSNKKKMFVSTLSAEYVLKNKIKCWNPSGCHQPQSTRREWKHTFWYIFLVVYFMVVCTNDMAKKEKKTFEPKQGKCNFMGIKLFLLHANTE